jgi:hypothetical protein
MAPALFHLTLHPTVGRCLRPLVYAYITLASVSATAAPPLPAVQAQAVQFAPHLHNGDRIGKIRLLGLLQLPSFTVNGLRFAEFSDLAWDDDEGVLYAESDQGALFRLQPTFTGDYLTGVRLLDAVPLREAGTDKPVRWTRTDAEGMDILNGRNGRNNDAQLIISFEREPRILRYDTHGHALEQYPLPPPLDDVHHYQGPNKALEAVCHDAHHGILTVPELPLRGERAGYTRIFDLHGHYWYYPVEKNAGVVALDCPGRDQVLVLERDYRSAALHTIITLRRVHLAADLPSGSTLDPETLVRLDDDAGLALDNFEGLAHQRGQRYFMVSDNNDVFLQRSLLLYFEILDEPAGRR